MAEARGPVERPLSPHLFIYRQMLTMLMSIAHRITGTAALFRHAADRLVAAAAASGPNAYADRTRS